jgi:predicted transcriptional regulator of viral defense system
MKLEDSSTKAASTYTPSLSRREAALLAGWERARRSSITLEDLRQIVGPAAQDVVKSLLRKHVFDRVGPGIYLLKPLRSLHGPTATSPIVAIATLLRGQPYYLGGLWAFSHYHLTPQQYVSALDVFVNRRRPPQRFGGTRVAFHVLPAKLLGYGLTTTTAEGVELRTSDIERTLLDVLDRPQLAGNMTHALALFQEGLPKADLPRLVDHAVRGSRSSTCQRLGVLLERRHAPRTFQRKLAKKIAGTRSLLSMQPDSPRVGHVNKTWRVVENDP